MIARQAISKQEEKKFLEFVKNDPHYCQYYDGFLLLFKTGMWISEFCGLTVEDLDFWNEIININHQLQRTRITAKNNPNLTHLTEEARENTRNIEKVTVYK